MTVSDVTALLASGTGFLAAFYWFRASKVAVMAAWDYEPKLAPKNMAQDAKGTADALERAFYWSSRKNALAAVWTAVSVGLGAISILAAKWPLISN
jgi:hypothetical protein